jgi:hypothetical protein
MTVIKFVLLRWKVLSAIQSPSQDGFVMRIAITILSILRLRVEVSNTFRPQLILAGVFWVEAITSER